MEPNTKRYEHIEKRSAQAYSILATMTVGSGLVCCFGPWIPELLLQAAAGTLIGAGLGVIGFGIIRVVNALQHLSSM